MLQTANASSLINASSLSASTSVSCFVCVRGGYPLSLPTWWRLVVKILTFFIIVLVWFVVCYFMNGVSRLTVLCRSYFITVGWGVGGSLCPFSTRNLQQKQMRAEVLCDVCRLCKANSEKCRTELLRIDSWAVGWCLGLLCGWSCLGVPGPPVSRTGWTLCFWTDSLTAPSAVKCSSLRHFQNYFRTFSYWHLIFCYGINTYVTF